MPVQPMPPLRKNWAARRSASTVRGGGVTQAMGAGRPAWKGGPPHRLPTRRGRKPGLPGAAATAAHRGRGLRALRPRGSGHALCPLHSAGYDRQRAGQPPSRLPTLPLE